MVLNQDVPPSTLYSEDFIREQMRFIVERYHDEQPSLLGMCEITGMLITELA